MAQFTAQGAIKLLFNGEGRSFRQGSQDSFRFRLGSIHVRKRMFRFLGSSAEHGSWRRNARSSRKRSEEDVHGEGDEYDDEFGVDEELACFRGLVLDVAYRPVNVVCWRRAICLEFMEKADVLEYYDQTVNSPSGSFYIPAVLRVPHLLQVVKRRRVKNNLSRKNILYRDSYTCQYCSSGEDLTIDHVLPISRGGEWTWENLELIDKLIVRALFYPALGGWFVREFQASVKLAVKSVCSLLYCFEVTACSKCNSKKGQKTIDEANMKLLKTPKAPKDFDILAIPLTSAAVKMLRRRNGTPEEWRQYLGRSSSEP